MSPKRKVLLSTLSLLALSSCTHIKMGLFLTRDNPRVNAPDSVAQGKLAFESNCAVCHGINGAGTGPQAGMQSVPPTNFRSPDYKKSAPRIAARIVYGKGESMPAFGDRLPDQTIWDIANYLHSLQPLNRDL